MRLILILIILAFSAPAPPRPIQDQGSSPYCLFATTAYLTGQDMWRLAAEYQRRNLPTVDGVTPSARPVIDLASEARALTIGAQWDTATVQTTVQSRPVAVTGHNHAVVLIGWRNGIITYLDPLHAERLRTMSDHAFWAWWDGWAWWVQE